MLLRWKLAVVVGGGAGAAREAGLRLARSGCGVLVADPDLTAAEAVAEMARERRVSAWSLRVDPGDDVEVAMLAGRCRDLGGADIVVTGGLEQGRAEAVVAALVTDATWLPVDAVSDDAARAAAALAAVRTAEREPVAVRL